jgi:hypothetical protein
VVTWVIPVDMLVCGLSSLEGNALTAWTQPATSDFAERKPYTAGRDTSARGTCGGHHYNCADLVLSSSMDLKLQSTILGLSLVSESVYGRQMAGTVKF